MNDPRIQELAVDLCDEIARLMRGEVDEPESHDVRPPPDERVRDLMAQARVVKPQARPAAKVGQVWAVRPIAARGVGAMVALVRVGGPVLRGILATDLEWLAAADDVVLRGNLSPTGEPFVLHLWRAVSVSRAALGPFVGVVPNGTFSPVMQELETGARPTVALESGPPLGGPDDPRREVRAALRRATAYLEEGALGAEQVSVPLFAQLASRLRDALTAAGALLGDATDPLPSGARGQEGGLLDAFALKRTAAAAMRNAAEGAAREESIAARCTLGDLSVEIDVRLEATATTIAVAATHTTTGDPLADLRVSCTMEKANGESTSVEQRTDDLGVASLAVPIREGLRYRLAIGRGEREQVVEW
jgi:hypothetical protein